MQNIWCIGSARVPDGVDERLRASQIVVLAAAEHHLTRLPRASTSASILVVNPPRDRPLGAIFPNVLVTGHGNAGWKAAGGGAKDVRDDGHRLALMRRYPRVAASWT